MRILLLQPNDSTKHKHLKAMNLSQKDYEVSLECIRELYSFRDITGLRSWLLDTALPRLVPSDWISYNEVDLFNPANTLAILKPESSMFAPLFERFRQVVHQHPLIIRQMNVPDFQVQKISDFLNQEAFHRLDLYQDVYRIMGVEYQIAATIKLEPDRVTAFALSRRENDYTERDRTILDMLRPHLVVAINHLALAAEWRNLRESATLALHELASATIIVDQEARILYHAGPGLDWIGVGNPRALPGEILNWLKHLPPQAALASTLRLKTDAGAVQIRAVPTTSPERTLLVLTLENQLWGRPGADDLGLTPRENEVAGWICEGKTNGEIAAILGISPRTVQKHVEHIFERLGVESRVAMTVRFRDRQSRS